MTSKRIMPWLLALLLLGSLFLPVAAEPTASDAKVAADDSYEEVAENALFLLEADLSSGLFRLTDKKTGYVRYSVPQGAEEDAIAVGQNKMQLQSQLVVYYRNKKTNIFVVNSKVSCINRKSIQVKKIDGGIRVEYIFKNEDFVIPVEYTLNDEYLEAKVLTNAIEETGENKITKIDLLPYFMSGGDKENGYIMVPDGSGALIYFNNQKTKASDYYASVYGSDVALNAKVKTTNNETVRFPVCGIRNSDVSGMLATVVSGDALADIGAGVSGKKNTYNHAWFTFRYREEESQGIMEMNMNTQREVISVAKNSATVDFVVRYYPLNDENGGTGYSSMASLYRKILLQDGKLAQKSAKSVLLVDVLGSAKVKKSILGIPTVQTEPLTTLGQASAIAAELQQAGIADFVFRYTGWGEDGLKNVRIPSKLSVQNTLGTIKSLQMLNESFANAGLSLYLDVDLLSFYQDGNGFKKNKDSIKNIFGLQSWQEKEDWFLGSSAFDPYLLLTPEKIQSATEQYVNSSKGNGFETLSLSRFGTLLYSDFSSEKAAGREETKAIWQSALKYADDNTDSLMVQGGNLYALLYADTIIEAPATYSGYDIEDESIPFYSMVTHGLLSSTISAMNLSSQSDYMLLKAVESGMGISYICSAVDTNLLKSTEHNELFAGNFSDWKDNAVSQYARIYPFLTHVQTSAIVGHEQVQAGVYKTLYENGAYSVVNYNADAVTVDGVQIPPMDFITSVDGTDSDIVPATKNYAALDLRVNSFAWVWGVLGCIALLVCAVFVFLIVKKKGRG